MKTSRLGQTLLYTALVLWLVLAALPVLWTVVISLRTYVDAFSAPLKWLAPITFENYRGLWVDREFYRNFTNTVVVTLGTVCISLSVGCLAGYALSRYRGSLGFWLLIIALVFRALPHATLLPSFHALFDAIGIRNTTFSLIFVLVAVNQPFTIWMLRSFFVNIPQELDEAAMVDGCTRLQAFRRVIIPVMWPGVVTTGLFSFLLAYNDFATTSMLLSSDNQTMVPKISSFLGSVQEQGNVMFAVAAVVSATVPLFILVLFFQRQIVSGLTAGAVKG